MGKSEIIFNLVPCVVILLDENKNIIEVNEKMRDYFGYEIEEIKGKNVYQLPVKREKIEELFENAVKIVKIDFLTKDGKSKIGIGLLEEVKGEREKYILVIHDVTEEELLRIKLKEEEKIIKEWENLAEKSLSGIYIYDENFNFLFVNPAFCEIFCLPREEIMKKKVYELIYPEDIPLLKEMARKRFSGEIESASFILRAIDRNGRLKYGKVSGRVTKIGDRKVIIGTVIDITETKEYEEELKKEQKLLEKTLEGIIYAITRIVETRDPYTAGHQVRVAKLSEAIAKEIGLKNIKEILWASFLHDIGKISVPSEILVMPRKLNPIEFEVIKTHPITGYSIVKIIPNFERVAEIILQHHERIDGTGYPKGLKGEEILKEARIIGVSDVVEAMLSYRPYRPALTIDDAIEEIYKNKGIKYEEEIAEVCIELFRSKKFSFEE
jgi:PAS domain S-box-containing protein/putative nucleotidyltransferase with HDIG domain